ncbi:hypothetical protein BDV28DRAFT_144771 [Aspergillus coremiiformis]|uniref:Uncharacterized protein n=1 Tax=Aspergillus coremiiformis TaxID=138285 RepID=A0A5N6ZHL1_9EURO|nr:hypothetical protein BDV28DRAFT_144771 [Aspergillus coremiiformis]
MADAVLAAFHGKLLFKDAWGFDKAQMEAFIDQVFANPKDHGVVETNEQVLTSIHEGLKKLRPKGELYTTPAPEEQVRRKKNTDKTIKRDNTVNPYIWTGYSNYFLFNDLLGLFFSLALAPVGATRDHFFLPWATVYGKWCALQHDKSLQRKKALKEPTYIQCTWRTGPGEEQKAFCMGASASGYASRFGQVDDKKRPLWREHVKRERFDLLGQEKINNEYAFYSSPELTLQGENNGWDFGNCAETYPFLKLLRDSPRTAGYECHGFAISYPLVLHGPVKDGARRDYEPLGSEHLSVPCKNCEVLITMYGYKVKAFTPAEAMSNPQSHSFQPGTVIGLRSGSGITVAYKDRKTDSHTIGIIQPTANMSHQDGFYIYSSSATGRQEPNVIIAESTTSGTFLSKLEGKVLVVQKQPAPEAAFHVDDKWATWLRHLDDTGLFTVAMTTDGKEIDHFAFELSSPLPLIFRSTRSALTSAFGDDAADVAAPGYVDARLCCGLVPPPSPPTADIALATVWQWTGLPAASIPELLKPLLVRLDWTLPQGHRNALWFNPEAGSRTTVRLVFNLLTVSALDQLHLDALNVTITRADLVCKKFLTAGDTGEKIIPVEEGTATLAIRCDFTSSTGVLPMVGALEFADDIVALTLRTDADRPVGRALGWLAEVIGVDGGALDFVQELMEKDPFTDLQFRQIELELDLSGPMPVLLSFRLSVQVSTVAGQDPSSGHQTFFLLSYLWDHVSSGLGVVRGELWAPSGMAHPQLAPGYEDWTNLEPLPRGAAILPMQIKYLIPGQVIDSLPDAVPDTITRASVMLSQQGVQFGATVAAKENVAPGNAPQPYLGRLMIDAAFEWGQTSSFSFDVHVLAGVQPSSRSVQTDPARLTGQLSYKRS